ncbi:unannotated protein [freshwater metagenome]|uniref:Unannotated protein n=1 Tax=freshwater metagenome TaxID=449393 RepID=A0A6J7IPX5_9ZZZZ
MEKSTNELTSTLHLSKRESIHSPIDLLADYVASLPHDERDVVAQIQSSGGEKAMVLIYRGESKGSRFLITHDGASIGRGSSSSIFLDDVTVSRSHALIEKEDAGFLLRDCGSLNGTYINGDSVKEVFLKSGDAIQIGKFHLLFVCGQSDEIVK